MTLRQAVRQNEWELAEGIQWVAFFKRGRGWDSEVIYVDDFNENSGELTIDNGNRELMNEILKIDANAVLLNGYYSNVGANEDGSHVFEKLVDGVRWQYDNGFNLLADAI